MCVLHNSGSFSFANIGLHSCTNHCLKMCDIASLWEKELNAGGKKVLHSCICLIFSGAKSADFCCRSYLVHILALAITGTLL